jgi:hypothetical protein
VYAAMEPKLLAKHNITHIVSMLPDWPSAGPHHLSIHLNDEQMENLLEHLPRVCDFIDQGWRPEEGCSSIALPESREVQVV